MTISPRPPGRTAAAEFRTNGRLGAQYALCKPLLFFRLCLYNKKQQVSKYTYCLVRVAIQNFLKNQVISTVFRLSVQRISLFLLHKITSERATVRTAALFHTPLSSVSKRVGYASSLSLWAAKKMPPISFPSGEFGADRGLHFHENQHFILSGRRP